MGDLLLTLRRSREAIEHYEKAVAAGGRLPVFHHRLVLAYYQIGDQQTAESHLEALRIGSLSADDVAGWRGFYDDLVDRLSRYGSDPDMLFRVANLDPIPNVP